MSFEGHYQIICKAGHSDICDCYDNPVFENPAEYQELWTCHCGQPAAWWNLVDTTNGSYCDCALGQWHMYGGTRAGVKPCEECDNGIIDGSVELEIDQPEEIQVCNLGHKHIIREATYKIPRNKGYLVGEKQ